jgi:hypothetical protein
MAFNRTYNAGNVDTQRGAVATVIPPGEYDVLIAECTEGISKGSGKNMLKLELNILTPPYDKRKMWYYIVDDQYADQKTYDIFASAGKQPPRSIHAGIFKGLRCKVKTRNREYNGETQAEVNYWIKQNAPSPSTAPAPAGVDPAYGPGSKTNPDEIPF